MIFLGCDGGSTKTEWLLVDHTGQVLAHRIFPGCNFAFWGEDGFRDLMVRSVQTCWQTAASLLSRLRPPC